ncbi:MAG: restriction endonuclease subunit S [Planctomycetes bacterium]|nr:restriction endonuclease subunit S [Planctomycetota bacterium]
MTAVMQYGSSSKTSERSGGVPVLRMGNIKEGKLVLEDLKYLPHDHDEFPALLLREGDIVFNRTNSAELVGKSAVYHGSPSPSSFASYLIRLRLKDGYSSDYLAHYINSNYGRDWVRSVVSQQVGQANVNGTKLRGLQVPVPPLNEQQRIVAEIEKQFTRLEAGVAALRRVQANLERYRAAVLKAACEGRLVPTEAELARQSGRTYDSGGELLGRVLSERRRRWIGARAYTEPEPIDDSRLPRLPDGWTWSRLEQLGVTTGGLTKNPRRAKMPRQLPYLRVANVYANELRLDEIEHIGVDDSELKKLLLRAGDLLIVEGNGSKDQIGRLAIWDGAIEPCVHQNHLIKVRPVVPALAKWIQCWLGSPAGRGFVELVASSTSGLYTLSVNKVGELPVALPPLAEQAQIVGEVERLSSIVADEQNAVRAALDRATRLRQAILQRAFEGKLVDSAAAD